MKRIIGLAPALVAVFAPLVGVAGIALADTDRPEDIQAP